MRLISIEKFYYGFVSSISILIFAVILGSLIKNILNYFLISPEEYFVRYDWKVQECKRFFSNDEQKYQRCIEDIRKDLLLERKYNLKKSIIEFFGYSVTLIMIFLYHYSRFKKIKDN